VKRIRLLQHLQRHGCLLKREGGSHSIWRNPVTNEMQSIPTARLVRTSREKFAGNCRFLSRVKDYSAVTLLTSRPSDILFQQTTALLEKLPAQNGVHLG